MRSGKGANSEKRVVVSVINDLLSDNRVDKTCRTLQKAGYQVLLLGRQRRNSPAMNERPYVYKRMRLLFETGVLFYVEWTVRLFFALCFRRYHLLWANDLDTLLPNFLASRCKGVPLIYDSHEFFTEVPELKNRPLKRKLWLRLERTIVPHLSHVFTVCTPIADYFQRQYGVEARILRNIPNAEVVAPEMELSPFLDHADGDILLWQGGGCNIDRGMEELVAAMVWVNAHLYIIGAGDVYPQLQAMVEQRQLQHKITFLPRMPYASLMRYTRHATLGFCIDKPTNQNYLISLPNKLFDYIRAELPMLVSPLPEIAKIVDQYHIGEYISSYEPEALATQINAMLSNRGQLAVFRQHLHMASQSLSWEEEAQTIFQCLDQINHHTC